jgi:hypothetical protein
MRVNRQAVKSVFAGPWGNAYLGTCAFLLTVIPTWIVLWSALGRTGWFDASWRSGPDEIWQRFPNQYPLAHTLLAMLLATMIAASVTGTLLWRRKSSGAVIATFMLLAAAFVAVIVYTPAGWSFAREDVASWIRHITLAPGATSL